MTELGVYILGATALAILAAAGLVLGNNLAVTMACVSSGAAYLSQVGAATYVISPSKFARFINATFMLVALAAWAVGVAALQ